MESRNPNSCMTWMRRAQFTAYPLTGTASVKNRLQVGDEIVQMVEWRTVEPEVLGSNPDAGKFFWVIP